MARTLLESPVISLATEFAQCGLEILRVLFKCATEANPSGQQDSRESVWTGFWVLGTGGGCKKSCPVSRDPERFRVQGFGFWGFKV